LPEVVEGVRVSVPKSHIACTQLSQRCAATLPSQEPSHLGNRPARGRAANACCIGSVVVGLERASSGYAPSLKAHRAFVNKSAPTALCEGRAGN
jgi:competence protein ComEC